MPALALALTLACVGDSTVEKRDSIPVSGTASGSSDYGHEQSFSGAIMITREQKYADQVDVELDGSNGRIRLPPEVLPILHGGDRDWFDLQKLQITDNSIDASAGINFADHPRLHIDRLTGTISITGRHGTYRGRCEAVEPGTQRKF